MQSPRLIQLRDKYLNEIQIKRSQGKHIIYLDETWYDTHDTLKKGYRDESGKCVTNAPCSRGKRLIILHAGSENGWIPGGLLISSKSMKNSSADYHEDMDSKLFENWFRDQLLPNIPENSVIVMDNASYHSRQLEKIPRKGTRKAEIIDFLVKRGISYPEKSTVKQLLEIVSKNENLFKKVYAVDEMAQKAGHEVCRLPPYYCIFNPIELMWSYLKKTIRRENITPTVGECHNQNSSHY